MLTSSLFCLLRVALRRSCEEINSVIDLHRMLLFISGIEVTLFRMFNVLVNRRRYSCDCTGIAPPFLSFLRRFHGGKTGNPTRAPLKIAYRGAQEGPVRACGAGLGKHQGDGRRAQDGRAAACVRCSVGVAACGHRRREARKRRTGVRHHRRHANKRHQ